jgi:GNAT superfamily N-acetyltransferase
MIDFDKITPEELQKMEEERVKHIPAFMCESPSDNKFINELRFNHNYVLLEPFLISNNSKLELQINDHRKVIHIAYIGVTESLRKQGYGSQIMETLTSLADKYGYSMDLDIVPKFGVNKTVLRKFYKKHGFVTKEGYNKDYMVRPLRGA